MRLSLWGGPLPRQPPWETAALPAGPRDGRLHLPTLLDLAGALAVLPALSLGKLGEPGLVFFTVFSEEEPSFGRGEEVESNTYESRPGRPTHYFTEDDLREHFRDFEVIETGILQEPEDHGGQPHTHILRYILAKKST